MWKPKIGTSGALLFEDKNKAQRDSFFSEFYEDKDVEKIEEMEDEDIKLDDEDIEESSCGDEVKQEGLDDAVKLSDEAVEVMNALGDNEEVKEIFKRLIQGDVKQAMGEEGEEGEDVSKEEAEAIKAGLEKAQESEEEFDGEEETDPEEMNPDLDEKDEAGFRTSITPKVGGNQGTFKTKKFGGKEYIGVDDLPDKVKEYLASKK